MVQQIRVQCEWDIGLENVVYGSEEEAREAVRKILPQHGIEESLEELEDEGLVVYEYVETVGEVRYQLVNNDIGDDYAIPIDKTDEWYTWVDTESAGAGDGTPEWAIRVKDGFTFTDPEF